MFDFETWWNAFYDAAVDMDPSKLASGVIATGVVMAVVFLLKKTGSLTKATGRAMFGGTAPSEKCLKICNAIENSEYRYLPVPNNTIEVGHSDAMLSSGALTVELCGNAVVELRVGNLRPMETLASVDRHLIYAAIKARVNREVAEKKERDDALLMASLTQPTTGTSPMISAWCSYENWQAMANTHKAMSAAHACDNQNPCPPSCGEEQCSPTKTVPMNNPAASPAAPIYLGAKKRVC